MRRSKLVWQLYPPFLLITVLSLVVVTWYSSSTLRQFHLERTREDLEAKARLVTHSVADNMSPHDPTVVNALSRELAGASSSRITVILPSGKVIGDSEEDPLKMDNHADRPEIASALRCALTRLISSEMSKSGCSANALAVCTRKANAPWFMVVILSIPLNDLYNGAKVAFGSTGLPQ